MNSSRKNISQPIDWWAAFEAAATRTELTLSEWIGASCLAKLPAADRKRLSKRPPANRPKGKANVAN